jgi:hypothetical protein
VDEKETRQVSSAITEQPNGFRESNYRVEDKEDPTSRQPIFSNPFTTSFFKHAEPGSPWRTLLARGQAVKVLMRRHGYSDKTPIGHRTVGVKSRRLFIRASAWFAWQSRMPTGCAFLRLSATFCGI